MKQNRQIEKNLYIRSTVGFLAILLICIPVMGTARAEDEADPVAQEIETVQTVDGRECVAGEVIVVFDESASSVQIESTVQTMGGEVDVQLPEQDTVVVEVPEGDTVEEFIDTIENQPDVEYAQPNYIYWLDATVDDPYAQIGGEHEQYYLDTVNVYEAWDTTLGESTVTVAVLDTGVDLDHEDLAGQATLRKEVDGDNAYDDDNGHGTHVSGIIAAATNNATGVAGIAPNVELLVIDVFESYYDGSEWKWGASSLDIADALGYAAANGADVVNMSLGGYYSDTYKENAVNSAVAAGVVCIASAGNDNVDSYHTPSDYDSCISVVATNEDDTKSSFSNYGAQKDIAAPGYRMLSTYVDFEMDSSGAVTKDDPCYAYISGTSMAAPVVTAVVALMLSVNPALTVDQVKNILYDTAADLGDAGKDVYFGYGRIDAQEAVEAAASYVPITGVDIEETSISLNGGQTYTLTVTQSPAEAVVNCMEWTSSDESVATVANGKITLVACGTATITGTTVDGGYADSVAVTVTQSVEGVEFDTDALVLESGQTAKITALVYPDGAGNQNVSYVSGNEGVATVDTAGNVKAVADGETILTATSQDGGYTDTSKVYVAPKTLQSSVYTFDRSNGIISGITLGTTAVQLKANMTNKDDYVLVFDNEGAQTSDGVVSTGMSAQLVIAGQQQESLVLVIRGECNGDGAVSIADYTMVRLDILNINGLSGAGWHAGDVNADGVVGIDDYTMIRLHILGIKTLN